MFPTTASTWLNLRFRKLSKCLKDAKALGKDFREISGKRKKRNTNQNSEKIFVFPFPNSKIALEWWKQQNQIWTRIRKFSRIKNVVLIQDFVTCKGLQLGKIRESLRIIITHDFPVYVEYSFALRFSDCSELSSFGRKITSNNCFKRIRFCTEVQTFASQKIANSLSKC